MHSDQPNAGGRSDKKNLLLTKDHLPNDHFASVSSDGDIRDS